MQKMQPIATIRTGFASKFGIPRQSGLVPELKGTIVFNPEYRNPDALRGLEGFSHIWLIWEFSEAIRQDWSPTVRPPRLGGNTRLGVFATRSPFRPNPIGLSCVKLESIELSTPQGPTDCVPDATSGFTGSVSMHQLQVVIPEQIAAKIKPGTLAALRGILAQDPRPRYQDDPEREYGFDFDGYSVKFKVPDADTLIVTSLQA